MANPKISISEEGHGAVRFEARLRALESNLAAMPTAAVEIMEALDKYTDAHWGEGVHVTESTYTRWPEWQPLENTGALRASLTRSDSPGAVREITPTGFKWGTSIPYAKFLYKGTRKMKPKPVVKSLRSLRGVAGYYMWRFLRRGVF